VNKFNFLFLTLVSVFSGVNLSLCSEPMEKKFQRIEKDRVAAYNRAKSANKNDLFGQGQPLPTPLRPPFPIRPPLLTTLQPQ